MHTAGDVQNPTRRATDMPVTNTPPKPAHTCLKVPAPPCLLGCTPHSRIKPSPAPLATRSDRGATATDCIHAGVSTLAVAQLPDCGGSAPTTAAAAGVSWGACALRVMLTGFFLSVFHTCKPVSKSHPAGNTLAMIFNTQQTSVKAQCSPSGWMMNCCRLLPVTDNLCSL